jgi:hypothetical protein
VGKCAKKDRSHTFWRGIEPCVVSDASDADRARGGWQSGGSSTVARRDRLAARTSAVSRALDGRAGRTRSRSSPRETPAIGEERATKEHGVASTAVSHRGCSDAHAPQPLPELPRVLESARGHLEVHAGHDLEGGKRRERLGRARHGASSPAGYTLSRNARVPPRLAARASTPRGSPDRSRARAAPRRALPDRPDRCSTRTGVWRDERRGAGSRSRRGRRGSRSPQLRKEISPSMPSRVGQEKRVDQNLAVRHLWTRFNVQKSYDVLYMGIWSGNATDFLANGSAGFWIHARVANAASRTDTAFLLGRKSRTVVEENATSALQRAVLARAIPTPPTLPIRA